MAWRQPGYQGVSWHFDYRSLQPEALDCWRIYASLGLNELTPVLVCTSWQGYRAALWFLYDISYVYISVSNVMYNLWNHWLNIKQFNHWKPRVVIMPTLSLLVALDAVVITTPEARTGDKVGIMTTPGFHLLLANSSCQVIYICQCTNSLSPVQHQAIVWTNAGSLLIGNIGTNLSEIFNQNETVCIHQSLFENCVLRMTAILP